MVKAFTECMFFQCAHGRVSTGLYFVFSQCDTSSTEDKRLKKLKKKRGGGLQQKLITEVHQECFRENHSFMQRHIFTMFKYMCPIKV